MRRLLLLLLFLTTAGAWAETIKLKSGADYLLVSSKPYVRFVNTDKTVVSVRLLDQRQFRFTGLKPGTAYVYFWDQNKEHTVVKVQVLFDPQQKKKESKSGKGRAEIYFKFDPENKTPVNKRMVSEKIYYDTMVGPYALSLFAENKNIGKTDHANIEQLSQFRLRLSRGNNFFTLGDDVIQYTSLTTQYLTMQGAHGRINLGNAYLDLFGGKLAGEYYGGQVLDHATTDKSKNNVQGGRVGLKLNENVSLGATSITGASYSGDDDRVKTNKNIKSVDAALSFNDLSLSLETAASSLRTVSSDFKETLDASAQEYKADYSTPVGGWTLVYRDIDSKYFDMSDFPFYRGAKGYFFNGRYSGLKFLGVSGYYENYLQRYNNTLYGLSYLTNNEYTNERARMNFNFMLGFVRPMISVFNTIKINPEYNIYSEYKGYSVYLDQVIAGPVSSYFEFSPVTYKDIQYEQLEYLGSITKSGVRTKFGFLSIRLEHQGEIYHYQNADSFDPHGYNFVVYLSRFMLPRTTINTDISYWFQNRKNSQETLDKNVSSVRLSLSQSLTPDIYWYLNGVASQENSLKYEYEKRVGYFYNKDLTRSEISGGCVYNF